MFTDRYVGDLTFRIGVIPFTRLIRTDSYVAITVLLFEAPTGSCMSGLPASCWRNGDQVFRQRMWSRSDVYYFVVLSPDREPTFSLPNWAWPPGRQEKRPCMEVQAKSVRHELICDLEHL